LVAAIAAAIAGIIVGSIAAAILALALIGGGTYAAATAFNNEDGPSVNVNPIYISSGDTGVNPMSV